MQSIRVIVWLLVFGMNAVLDAGELRVASVFSDHAVLQRDDEVPVWGTATAGEQIMVRFAGQTKSVQVADDGSWQIVLAPLTAQSSGSTMIVESTTGRLEIHDLLVGEVWYASGQSNMQMTLGACARKNEQIREFAEAETLDVIRMTRIDQADSPEPLLQIQNPVQWKTDNRANRPKQSAVAYFFARQLHEKLGVPIGIIEASWGGKPIEGFIARSEFNKHPVLREVLSLSNQNRLAELAELRGGVVIRNTAGMPGRIFNARVAPIAPYAMRGVIWYQGESNAGRGEDPRHYRLKMRALVDSFRTAWGRNDLPLYFVQLPSFTDQATGWIRLREEQRRSLTIEHTGMAVTIDLRDTDIHPANKLDVGDRLSRWALAKTYGQEIPYSGPLFKFATVDGDRMRVEFDHAEGGLMVAHKEGIVPPRRTTEDRPAHFELADQKGHWFPARATIRGDFVEVHSPQVSEPVAVRYACLGAPSNANLYNGAGLPASPFCSDLRRLPWDPAK